MALQAERLQTLGEIRAFVEGNEGGWGTEKKALKPLESFVYSFTVLLAHIVDAFIAFIAFIASAISTDSTTNRVFALSGVSTTEP